MIRRIFVAGGIFLGSCIIGIVFCVWSFIFFVRHPQHLLDAAEKQKTFDFVSSYLHEEGLRQITYNDTGLGTILSREQWDALLMQLLPASWLRENITHLFGETIRLTDGHTALSELQFTINIALPKNVLRDQVDAIIPTRDKLRSLSLCSSDTIKTLQTLEHAEMGIILSTLSQLQCQPPEMILAFIDSLNTALPFHDIVGSLPDSVNILKIVALTRSQGMIDATTLSQLHEPMTDYEWKFFLKENEQISQFQHTIRFFYATLAAISLGGVMLLLLVCIPYRRQGRLLALIAGSSALIVGSILVSIRMIASLQLSHGERLIRESMTGNPVVTDQLINVLRAYAIDFLHSIFLLGFLCIILGMMSIIGIMIVRVIQRRR